MIEKTTFPSIYDESLSDFFKDFIKGKSNPVEIMSEKFSQYTANKYAESQEWLDKFGIQESDLSNFFVSVDLSSSADSWITPDGSSRYLFGSRIPLDQNFFVDKFSDNFSECILDLQAVGNKIKDLSKDGDRLDIFSSKGVSIVQDKTYGPVIHFGFNYSPTSQPGINAEQFFNNVPRILVSDNGTDKLKIHMSNSISSDTYFAIVFAKLNGSKNYRYSCEYSFDEDTETASLSSFTASIVTSDNEVPLFARSLRNDDIGITDPSDNSYENSPAIYKFSLVKGENSSMTMNMLESNSVGTVNINLNNNYQKNAFSMDRLMNQWTMFAVSLGPRLLINSPDITNKFRSIGMINAGIYPAVERCNQTNQTYSLNEHEAINFPNIYGSPKQYMVAENSPMMICSGTRRDFISRLKHVSYDSILPNADGAFNAFTEDYLNNSTLWIGSMPGKYQNQIKFLDGADIKFIKIYRLQKDTDRLVDPIMINEYLSSAFIPSIEKKMLFSLNADEDEDHTNIKTLDNSISGKYYSLTGDTQLFVNVPEFKNPFDLNEKVSLTMAAWISSDIFNQMTIAENGALRFKLSVDSENQYSDRAIPFNSNGTDFPVHVGNFLKVKGLNLSLELSTMVRNSYEYPFYVSDDQKWHHIAFTWTYPNVEVNNVGYDDSNAKFTVYVDGKSVNKHDGGTTLNNKYFLVDYAISTSDFNGLTVGNVFTLHPSDRAFNLKSFEIYEGNTLSGGFIQDQDIFNLYLRDYKKYFTGLPRNEFTVNMYNCNRIPILIDGENNPYKRFLSAMAIWSSKNYVSYLSGTQDYGVLGNANSLIFSNMGISGNCWPNIYSGYPYSEFDYGLIADIEGEINVTNKNIKCLIYSSVDDSYYLTLSNSDDQIVISGSIDELDTSQTPYKPFCPLLSNEFYLDKPTEPDVKFSKKLIKIDFKNLGRYHIAGFYNSIQGLSSDNNTFIDFGAGDSSLIIKVLFIDDAIYNSITDENTAKTQYVSLSSRFIPFEYGMNFG